MRFAVRLEFDGSNFCGWQEQSRESESSAKPSVQATVQKSLAKLLGTRKKIAVQGCGRTDAGVHAEEYVAHFDIDSKWFEKFRSDTARLRLGLNARLPASISANELVQADETFHALSSVKEKTYEYRLIIKHSKPALDLGRMYWVPGNPQDQSLFSTHLLHTAQQALLGEHDFVAFANSGHQVKTTRRKILAAGFTETLREQDRGREFRIWFTGAGFLKQQVRNMVGALVAIATGRRPHKFIDDLLLTAPQTGRKLPELYCVPANGLFLVKVEYDRPIFFPKK